MDPLSSLMGSYYSDDDGRCSSDVCKKRSFEHPLSELWDSTVSIELDENAQVINAIESFPGLEIWARNSMRKLHSLLETAFVEKLPRSVCEKLPLKSAVTLRNGDALWEHWHFHSISHSSNYFGILPDSVGVEFGKETLATEISKVSSVDVSQLVDEFTSRACSLIKANIKPPDSTLKNRYVKMILSGKTRVLSFKKYSHSIQSSHFLKLRDLFLNTGIEDEKRLNERIFTLLQRYDSLGGHGFQAAISIEAFDYLRDHFGVNFECFASPLNCRFSRFCSAFPDTDIYFGSLGSFFDFHPVSGSYEANPPFVESVTLKMMQHINNLLSKSDSNSTCMSFIVVVPSKFRDLISASKFHRGIVILEHRNHSYKAGAQHKKKLKSTVKSTCDTDIHVVQSHRGALQWPLTKEKMDEISASF